MIHSSELARFLNFSENREIAKEALLDRGLKKVKTGIEGFPIDMVDNPNASSSNAYRYEQRPYLIVSWEKVRCFPLFFHSVLFSPPPLPQEEKSNRHVFFQHVKRTRRRTQSPPFVD